MSSMLGHFCFPQSRFRNKLWSRNETQDSDVAPRKVPPRRAGSLLVDNLR